MDFDCNLGGLDIVEAGIDEEKIERKTKLVFSLLRLNFQPFSARN